MEDDKSLNLYYDHYKETNQLNREAQARRNKEFIIVCILEAVSFLMIGDKEFLMELLNAMATKELETTISFNTTILQSLSWILIAYFWVRYIQDTLYIERQYGYLKRIEKEIGHLLGKDSFNREGEYYLHEYPIILNLIELFYKVFVPILFTMINVAHIFSECQDEMLSFPFIGDTFTFLILFIFTWFYFFEIHSKMSAWFKKCGIINSMSKKLHRLLHYV